jgi:hypothetical protein
MVSTDQAKFRQATLDLLLILTFDGNIIGSHL